MKEPTEQGSVRNVTFGVAKLGMGSAAAEAAFTTLDPAKTATNIALANGNLDAVGINGPYTWDSHAAVHGKSSADGGKFYYESTYLAVPDFRRLFFGWALLQASYDNTADFVGKGTGPIASGGAGIDMQQDDVWIINVGRGKGTGEPSTTTSHDGQTFGVKLDLDNGEIGFVGRNGASLGMFAHANFQNDSLIWYPSNTMLAQIDGETYRFNFGASAFVHGLPAGYSGVTAV